MAKVASLGPAWSIFVLTSLLPNITVTPSYRVDELLPASVPDIIPRREAVSWAEVLSGKIPPCKEKVLQIQHVVLLYARLDIELLQ